MDQCDWKFVEAKEVPRGPWISRKYPLVGTAAGITAVGTAGSGTRVAGSNGAGTANGFGWKLNDVIGAQILSIPAKLADASAETALRAILLWLGGILGFVLVAANIIGLLSFGRSSSR
jgi:protein-histidine pros-kinase